MLHVGQIIDPHQDNQIDKQLQKKHENGKNMADAEIQDKLKHKQEVVKQQEIQQKEDFRQRKLQQKQAIKQQRQDRKAADEAKYEKLRQQFELDAAYHFVKIMIDFESQQILIRKGLLTPYQLYSFADFKGYKQIITPGTVKKHHGIARGIAGGLIAGPAGAVVGAVTGGTQYEVVREMSVIMYFKDNQQKKVRFISFETKTDSFTYRSAQESCLSFCQKLDEISTAQKQEQEIGQSSEQPTQAQYNTSDIADQLRQFKQLADDGVITQEEFEAKKKQLLGI